MERKKITAIIFAFLAAVFYAINIPFSKVLLADVSPTFMASFLYFGAGIGIGIIYLFNRKRNQYKDENLSKKDLPYTIGMIILDIAAPIFLMIGLLISSSANASLLNNFEIVATSIIALFIFKETISTRLWIGIIFITFSSILLSFKNISSFHFSYGSLFILAATVCWGLENNFTRKISSKNTYQIVVLKGIFSGLGSFIVAFIRFEKLPQLQYILCALLLGFVSFGLSIFLYIRAQKEIGAAKTSAYYAIAPFIGAILSFVLFKESLNKIFLFSLVIMLIGSTIVIRDTLLEQK